MGCCRLVVNPSTQDFLYVPAIHAADWIHLAHHFAHYGVMAEVAMPQIIYLLVNLGCFPALLVPGWHRGLWDFADCLSRFVMQAHFVRQSIDLFLDNAVSAPSCLWQYAFT